jgi:DNA-binding transcriptional ArsR family regulator
MAAATEIWEEREVMRLGSPTKVQVTMNYSEFSSDQVSMLVPPSHQPRNIQGADMNGPIPCEYSSVDNEILCSPGTVVGQYFVSINYTTPNPSTVKDGYHTVKHIQRILGPTERYSLKIVLPEGFGTVDAEKIAPYSPADAVTGSEGRRISIQWSEDDISLGDTLRFEINYQKLQVFDNIFSDRLALVAGLLLLVAVVGVSVYVKRQSGNKDTIAAIMPVLKEDEQDVLRFIVRQEGECDQKQVVENLSYSKAKVSRLVKDLTERNLIEKVKKGRKNHLSLAKEMGDIELEEA